jgi:hypothetical protein
MKELTELESILLNGLTSKYPQFKSHLPHLRVSDRKMTATGLDVVLEYLDFHNELDDTNALFSNGENIQIKALKEGLSYVIDITMGQITAIEFSTYNEKWDGKITDFKVVEKDSI